MDTAQQKQIEQDVKAARLMIANMIRDCRTRVNWSQKELATELGVTQKQVSQWERCVQEPSAVTLFRLVNMVGRRLVLK